MTQNLIPIGKARLKYADKQASFGRGNRSVWEVNGIIVSRVFKPPRALREITRTDKHVIYLDQFSGVVYAEKRV